MDNKKIIIIGVLLLIIVGAVLVFLTFSVNYETIEITPNGTTIDVPANQTRYRGEIDGVKVWNWDEGALVTYNSHEGSDLVKLTGFDGLKELIKNGEVQNIDGFTCYVINADELLEIHVFEFIKVNYNGKFYCIPLSNETTQDNIIICCKDRDMALHMAESVHYKNVYPDTIGLDDAISSVENMSGNLQSIASKYTNGTNLSDAVSTVENMSGDLKSKAEDYANSSDLDNVISTAEKMSGDLHW